MVDDDRQAAILVTGYELKVRYAAWIPLSVLVGWVGVLMRR